MKSSKRSLYFGLMFLLLLSTNIAGTAKPDNVELRISSTLTSNSLSLNYVDHGAIEIGSDGDFDAAHGVSAGSGTNLDPYIIEGWNITTATGSGIFIHDTSAHFVIRDCWINAGEVNSAPDFDSSIYLKYIADGTAIIEKNTGAFSSRGILLRGSDNNTLSKNDFYSNLDGIFLWESNNNTLIDNLCNSNQYGISMYLSSSNFLVNNTCNQNNNMGIYLYASHYNSLENNICASNYYNGIGLLQANNNYMVDNACSNNNRGIKISESIYNSVEDNRITNNEVGVQIYKSANTSITFNLLVSSKYHGIGMDSISRNNTMHHNYFINNGGTHQGYDDGVTNLWYDNSINEGNYWSDYNGTGNYSIDGVADTADLYPFSIDLWLDHLAPSSFEYGSIGNHVNWTVISTISVSDETPLDYIIYQNTTEVASGSLTNGYDIDHSIDGLALGLYNFSVLVTDYMNNTAKDSVYFTVIDTIGPFISSPVDITYAKGETGNTISWVVTDLDPDSYVIYQDGIEIDTGVCISGNEINLDIDGLAVGGYNIMINAVDHSGNLGTDTVHVEVTGTAPTDTGDPTLNTEGDFILDNLLYIVAAAFVILVGLAVYIFSRRKK